MLISKSCSRLTAMLKLKKMRKTKLGQELIAGLNDALAYERGTKRLRTTSLRILKGLPKGRSSSSRRKVTVTGNSCD